MSDDSTLQYGIDVILNVDTKNINDGMNALDNMNDRIVGMPKLSLATEDSVESIKAVGESIKSRSSRKSQIEYSGMNAADQQKFSRNFQSSATEFNQSVKMLTSAGSPWSVRDQHALMSSLTDSMRSAIDDLVPVVGSIIKTKTSSAYKGIDRIISGDIPTIVSDGLMKDTKIQRGLSKIRASAGYQTAVSNYSGGANKFEEDVLGFLTARTLPHYRTDKFASDIYGHSANADIPSAVRSVDKLIPASYMPAFRNKGYVARQIQQEERNNVLTQEALETLRSAVKNNAGVGEAAMAAGIASLNRRGEVQLQNNVTREDYENFRQSLYGVLENRTLGVSKTRGIAGSMYELNKDKLLDRLGGGLPYGVISEMQNLEKLEDVAAWQKERHQAEEYSVVKDAKRSIKQFDTLKYSPFAKDTNPRHVSIDDSSAISMLGLSGLDRYSDISDKIVNISLEGYDEKNKDHRKQLEELFDKGFTNAGGTNYSIVASHRGEGEVILRAVEAKAKADVDARLRPLANALGLKGSVWDMYEGEGGFKSLTAFRKHEDAVNKAFTRSMDTGVDLSNVKISIVDSTVQMDGKPKITPEDGVGWASGNVLSSSFQTRFGLGGKGSLVQVTEEGVSLRDFYSKAGLTTKDDKGNEHVYYSDGKGGVVDVIDSDIVLDKSLIKNLGAYANMSYDDTVEALKQLIIHTGGLRSVADYDDERKSGNRIGSQAMAFMGITDEVASLQQEGFRQRMRELETPEGIAKYVFANENDELARQIQNGNRELVNDQRVQERVQKYRDSLRWQIASGDIIDFGNNEGSTISRARIVTNPLNSRYEYGDFYNGTIGQYKTNGISDEVMKKARTALRSRMEDIYGNPNKVSDEELNEIIKDTLMLRSGNAIDFKALDRQVGYVRSPTGLGNYIYANNRAQEFRAIMNELGVQIRETDDVLFGNDDLAVLQGADKDGDEVKRLTGAYARLAQKAVEDFRKMRSRVTEGAADVQANPLGEGVTVFGTAADKADSAEALFAEGKHMAIADAIARAQTFKDLNAPENSMAVYYALRAAELYNQFSTERKKPIDTELSWQDYKEAGVGKDFQKFAGRVSGVFHLDDEMKDAFGNIISEDAIEDQATGVKINLKKLASLGMNNINTPSVFNAETDHARYLNALINSTGENDVSIEALSNAIDYIYSGRYRGDERLNKTLDSAGEATLRLLKANSKLEMQFLGGRAMLTQEETSAFNTLIENAENELRRKAKEIQDAGGKLINEYTGEEFTGRNAIKSWVNQQGRNYGLHVAKNTVSEFGATESNIRNKRGQGEVDFQKSLQGNRFRINELEQVRPGTYASDVPITPPPPQPQPQPQSQQQQNQNQQQNQQQQNNQKGSVKKFHGKKPNQNGQQQQDQTQPLPFNLPTEDEKKNVNPREFIEQYTSGDVHDTAIGLNELVKLGLARKIGKFTFTSDKHLQQLSALGLSSTPSTMEDLFLAISKVTGEVLDTEEDKDSMLEAMVAFGELAEGYEWIEQQAKPPKNKKRRPVKPPKPPVPPTPPDNGNGGGPNNPPNNPPNPPNNPPGNPPNNPPTNPPGNPPNPPTNPPNPPNNGGGNNPPVPPNNPPGGGGGGNNRPPISGGNTSGTKLWASIDLESEALKDLLTHTGGDLFSELMKPTYKEGGDYSSTWIRMMSARKANYDKKVDEALKSPSELIKDPTTGELTEFALKLSEQQDEIAKAYEEGMQAFLIKRGDKLLEEIKNITKSTKDVDAVSNQFEEVFSRAKELSESAAAFRKQATKNNTLEMSSDDERVYKLHLAKSREANAEMFAYRDKLKNRYMENLANKKLETERILDNQEMASFTKELDEYSRSTIGANTVSTIIGKRTGLEDAATALDQRVQAERDRLKDYEDKRLSIKADMQQDKDNNGNKNKELNQFKLDLVDADIANTQARLADLEKAAHNARVELEQFNSVDSFKTLGQQIQNSADQLRRMSRGTSINSGIETLVSMSDTLKVAEESNKRLREESGYYNNGKWDTSSQEGKNARDEYKRNLNLIKSLKGQIPYNIQAIENTLGMSRDNFLQSYGQNRFGSQMAGIYAFYNGKRMTANNQINQYKETIRQIDDKLGTGNLEASVIAALKRQKAEYQKSIKNIQREASRFESESQTDISSRFSELMSNAAYNADMAAAQGANAKINWERQQRQINNRSFNLTAYGRNLEYIRGLRENAEMRNNTLRPQIDLQQSKVDKLNNERKIIEDQLKNATTQEERDRLSMDLNLKDEEIRAATASLNNLNEEMKRNQQTMNQYKSSSDGFNAAMLTIQEAAIRTFRNLSTRIFRQAIQEARRFVVEYNKILSEIQVVTLTSDEQIDNISSSILDTSVKYKTDPLQVAKSAVMLYRQGLSEEEVNKRIEAITKFSTISGVNADVSSRLLTVALSGGMVDSVEKVFDTITAISDSMPTNPEEITKAFQRSMFSAKANGTTYDQLAAMAAAITSKTQLSGSVAGTTLSNIFSRMRRVRNGDEIIYDENNVAIASTDVSKALKLAEVDLYDRTTGAMRSTFDVLSDLGKVWEDLDSTTRGKIASSIAGSGRQAQNFDALMDAFTQVDESGKRLIDTLISLAEGAEGIVDSKVDVHLKSLDAALKELKASFDQLIEGLHLDELVTPLLNFASYVLQGLAAINDLSQGFVGMTAISASLAVMLKSIVGVAANVAGGAGLAVTGGIPGIVAGAVIALGALAKGISDFVKGINESEKDIPEVSKFDRVQQARNSINSIVDAHRDKEGNLVEGDLTETEKKSANQALRVLSEEGVISKSAVPKSLKELASMADKASKSLRTFGESVGLDQFTEEPFGLFSGVMNAFKGVLGYQRVAKQYHQNLKAGDFTDEDLDQLEAKYRLGGLEKDVRYNAFVRAMINSHVIEKDASMNTDEDYINAILSNEKNGKYRKAFNDKVFGPANWRDNIQRAFKGVTSEGKMDVNQSVRDTLSFFMSDLKIDNVDDQVKETLIDIMSDDIVYRNRKNLSRIALAKAIFAELVNVANNPYEYYEMYKERIGLSTPKDKNDIDISKLAEAHDSNNYLFTERARSASAGLSEMINNVPTGKYAYLDTYYTSVFRDFLENQKENLVSLVSGDNKESKALATAIHQIDTRVQKGETVSKQDLVSLQTLIGSMSDSYSGGLNMADKAERLKWALSRFKSDSSVTANNILIDEQLSQQLTSELLSATGITDPSTISSMTEDSYKYLNMKIEAESKGLKASPGRKFIAQAAKNLFEGEEYVFENTTPALLQLIESSIPDLSEYIAIRNDADQNDRKEVLKKKIKTQIDKLYNIVEGATDKALSLIDDVTSDDPTARQRARSTVIKGKKDNRKLVQYITKINEGQIDSNLIVGLSEYLGEDMTLPEIRTSLKTNPSEIADRLKNIVMDTDQTIRTVVDYCKATEDDILNVKVPEVNEASKTYLEYRDQNRLDYVERLAEDINTAMAQEFNNEDIVRMLADNQNFIELAKSGNLSASKIYTKMQNGETITLDEADEMINSILSAAGYSDSSGQLYMAKHSTISKAFDELALGEYHGRTGLSVATERVYESLPEERKAFLRNYARASTFGGEKYNRINKALEAENLLSDLASNKFDFEAYENLTEEELTALNEVTGNVFTSLVEDVKNLRISVDSKEFEIKYANATNAIVDSIFSNIREETVASWIKAGNNYKVDPSTFWQTYSNMSDMSYQTGKLERDYLAYIRGDRSDSIIDSLSGGLNLTKETVRYKPEAVSKRFQSKLSEFSDNIELYLKNIFKEDFSSLAGMSSFDIAKMLYEKGEDGAAALIESLDFSIDEDLVIKPDVTPIYDSIQEIINQASLDMLASSSTRQFGTLNRFAQSANTYMEFKALLEQEKINNPAFGKYIEQNADIKTLLANADSFVIPYNELQDIVYKRYAGTYGQDMNDYNFLWRKMFGSNFSDNTSWSFDSLSTNMESLRSTSPQVYDQAIELLRSVGGNDLADQLLRVNDQTGDLKVNAAAGAEALKTLLNTFSNNAIEAANKGSKAFERMSSTLKAISEGGSEAADVSQKFIQRIYDFNNTKTALQKYESGDRDKRTVGIVAGESYFDERDVKSFKPGSAMAAQTVMMPKVKVGLSEVELVDDFSLTIQNFINQGLAEIARINPEVLTSIIVDGNIDLSRFMAEFAKANSSMASTFNALITAWTNVQGTATINLSAEFAGLGSVDQQSLLKFIEGGGSVVNVSATAPTGKKYYGGSKSSGGGSSKTAADKLIERLKHGESLYEHQIKMYNYEEARYQNLDQLTNYGRVLEGEIELEKSFLPVLQQNIQALKDEMNTVTEGGEDWYKLRDALLSAEEKYATITNTIDENNKKLKENQQAILKTHTDLEEMVVAEIEKRIQRQRDMLAGNVDMQNNVLNAIKERYQKEWQLVKDDIDRKKKALEEEKALIDERLNKRKSAEDEAAKYEELAKLKAQYASVSMDSSRTKDAAALRKQIRDLEKEIGWDMAEAEAKAMSDAIQDQINAYDEFASTGDEDLDKLLEDANNFGTEVTRILGMSHDDLMTWLKSNDTEYGNSLGVAQEQILQAWNDTWKQMYGIVDTWWPEVNEILSSESSFMNYMSQSIDYTTASLDQQKQMLYQWAEAYRVYMQAYIDTANFNHTDPNMGYWNGSEWVDTSGTNGSGSRTGGTGGSGSSSLNASNGGKTVGLTSTTKNGTSYNIKIPGNITDLDQTLNDSSSSPWYLTYLGEKTGEYPEGKPYSYYYATQQAAIDAGNRVLGASGTLHSQIQADTVQIGSVKGGISSGNIQTVKQSTSTISSGTTYAGSSTSSSTSIAGTSSTKPNYSGHGWAFQINKDGQAVAYSNKLYSTKEAATNAALAVKPSGYKYSTKQYEHGGIADFTGPAWLDGTKLKPERILDWQQTKAWDELTDVLSSSAIEDLHSALQFMNTWSQFSAVMPKLMSFDSSSLSTPSISQTISDFQIILNEAKLEEDADYDLVAEKVGKLFSKELSKQGFNTRFSY